MSRRALLAGAGVLVVAGCGGSSGKPLPKTPPPALASRCGSAYAHLRAKLVWFRAKDGTLLDGAIVGQGQRGVILSHEFPADLCGWLDFAQVLARHGFVAFPFDSRGFGAAHHPAKISAEGSLDLDVQGAVDVLLKHGVKKYFVAGASAGGVAVMVAGPSLHPQPEGVVSFSGEQSLPSISPRLNALSAARKLHAPFLVVGSVGDPLVNAAEARALEQAAGSSQKCLALYPGVYHGWDLLAAAPYHDRVIARVLRFLRLGSCA